jgi:hypothetical protein
MIMSKNKIQKIARTIAAERQLNAAIQLWLNDGDSLAVHTLGMASYGLLHDLAALKDQNYKEWSSLVAKAHGGQARFRQTANQLKHAGRDSETPVDVPSNERNEVLLGAALVSYRVLTKDLSNIMGAFHLMMLMTHPDRFRVSADKDVDIEVGAQVAAEHLRCDIALRRKMVRGNLRLIQNGQLPSNINVRRGYHEDDH